jgi:hypothetical protein
MKSQLLSFCVGFLVSMVLFAVTSSSKCFPDERLNLAGSRAENAGSAADPTLPAALPVPSDASANAPLFKSRYICDSPLIKQVPNVRQEVLKRYEWASGLASLSLLDEKLNYHMTRPKPAPPPFIKYATGWSGLNDTWERFDFMGPVSFPCPTLTHFGSGDGEKRVCMTNELLRPGCSVFSVGSSNQW